MKADMKTIEFKRSLAPVMKLTIAQWIKRLNKMPPVKAGIAAGFVAWHRIFQEKVESDTCWKLSDELKELWEISSQAKPCSPDEYAACLREAGFPQDSCLVIKAAQEKLVIYAERQNIAKMKRGKS